MAATIFNQAQLATDLHQTLMFLPLIYNKL